MSAWRAAIAGTIAALLACVAVGSLDVGDPLMPVEIAGTGVAAAWLLHVTLATSSAYRLGRSLRAMGRSNVVAGVPCHVIAAGGRSAFVLGAVRPRIYLGADLIDVLDRDELRAVLLHEEHHRRTRAPLRLAALGAWRWLAGASSQVGRTLDGRLARIEIDADRFALRHGASREAIARALLKSGPPAVGIGFGAHASARVDHLLGMHVDGSFAEAQGMPYEWAPAVIVLGIIGVCHLVV